MPARSLPLKPSGAGSWLLAISLTRWNYMLSSLADATAAVVMLTWALVTLERPGALLPVAALALLVYTLIEYLWHRFLFHWRHAPRAARQGHARHHQAPEQPLALPFFTALPHVMVVWGLASVSGLGSSLGAFFTGVYFVGYVAYTGLHHLIHAEAIGHPAVAWLRSVHEVHHARPACNFGVTTPLWDIVFGTWLAPLR
ncbi:MAG: sterol desaturase family protein [Betaproteobacteria bacterium]